MKISYLLSSNKGNHVIKNFIDDIYSLEDHDFEVIICSDSDYKDNRAICIKDSGEGCVKAYNKAYKYSNGDIIILCADDHSLPRNVAKVIDFFTLDRIKRLKFKIANLTHILGGPGKLYYLKENQTQLDTVWWDLYSIFPSNTKNIRPYNVYHFPAILKETIETYMDGIIFNESFIHHYCDSWLGFYEEKINGIRECKDIGPIDIWFNVIPEINNSKGSSQYDSHDKEVLRKLIELSDNDIKYNTKV